MDNQTTSCTNEESTWSEFLNFSLPQGWATNQSMVCRWLASYILINLLLLGHPSTRTTIVMIKSITEGDLYNNNVSN